MSGLSRTARLIARSSLLLGLLGLPCGVPLAAQTSDRVVIRSSDGIGRLTRFGTIEDFDATQLLLRGRTNLKQQQFTADRVLSISTRRTEAQERGRQLLALRQPEEAREAFREALDLETRKWVRREIVAGLVRCALLEGNYQRASSQFLNLCDSRSQTRYFHLIPLAWTTSGRPDASLVRAARIWNVRDSEIARLLAASYLLDDPTYQPVAENALRSLQSSADMRVRGLASAQTWRIVTRHGQPTTAQIRTWKQQLRRLPTDLRGGPHFVMGQALLRRQEPGDAVAAFLWTSLVHNDDHHLAARATRQAADALLATGHDQQARTLYQDLSRRFPSTPTARETAGSRQPTNPGQKLIPDSSPPRRRRDLR